MSTAPYDHKYLEAVDKTAHFWRSLVAYASSNLGTMDITIGFNHVVKQPIGGVIIPETKLDLFEDTIKALMIERKQSSISVTPRGNPDSRLVPTYDEILERAARAAHIPIHAISMSSNMSYDMRTECQPDGNVAVYDNKSGTIRMIQNMTDSDGDHLRRPPAAGPAV